MKGIIIIFLDVSTYKDNLEEAERIWRKIIDQNTGIICLTKDNTGKIQIAGMNCTFVASKDDSDELEKVHFQLCEKN